MKHAHIKALALIFCVLLSACGCGDEPAQASQPAGAGTVTIANTGGTSFVVAASVSLPAEGQPRTVDAEATISALRFDAGATLSPPADFVSATLVLEIDGAPVFMAVLADSSEQEVVPDARQSLSGSARASITVPAGKRFTAVLYVGGGTDNNGAVIAWNASKVVATVRP